MTATLGSPSDLHTGIAGIGTGARETVEAPAKTIIPTRAGDAARPAVDTIRDTSKAQAQRVEQSVRQQPGRWAGAAAGILALAAAAAGVAVWQRNRRRPQHRAARIWQAATSRFTR